MTSTVEKIASRIAGFDQLGLLCIGDIMLDRYIDGQVTRMSPEAPVPVLTHREERTMLGGVGNVARNVVAMGGRADVVAILGADEPGREVRELCVADERLRIYDVVAPGRRTTQKVRLMADGQQLLRADQEDTFAPDEPVQQQVLQLFVERLAAADAVLLSDYAKGCLTERVVRETIKAARAGAKPVVVDPKSPDIGRYSGASVIKLNAGELEAATGIASIDDDTAARAAASALARVDVDAVVVTRSEQGMTLLERGREAVHFREPRREIYDVSGAGDTGLAAIGLALASGMTLAEAVMLANKACALAVSKVGTAVVYAEELLQALQSHELANAEAKLSLLPSLLDRVARWRAQGLRVGFTNGCFDLIHAGHVSLLAQARTVCDRLVVALNSDDSVRRLKGEGRPVNNSTARSLVLASLQDVDAVILFREDTPIRLIEAIRPDVLIKGADYRPGEVVGAEFVNSYGGRLFLAELSREHSTSATIDRIKG